MGDKTVITHNINLGLDGSIPRCDCNNFRLTGIPCEEACALICRLSRRPVEFVRDSLKLDSELTGIERALHGASIPNVMGSSLLTSEPTVLPPLLQPPPGRPSKKRKTKESARRAFFRAQSRAKARMAKSKASKIQESNGIEQSGKKNELKPSREYLCSRCGLSGHNAIRCRSHTDGRGTLIKKAEQIAEQKLSVIIEIQMPGQTTLPRSMEECALY